MSLETNEYYNLIKDILIPILTISLSVGVAYYVAWKQNHDFLNNQKNKENEEKAQLRNLLRFKIESIKEEIDINISKLKYYIDTYNSEDLIEKIRLIPKDSAIASLMKIENKEIYFSIKDGLNNNEIKSYSEFEDSIFDVSTITDLSKELIISFHENSENKEKEILGLFDGYFKMLDLLIREPNNKQKHKMFTKNSYADDYLNKLVTIIKNPDETKIRFYYFLEYIKELYKINRSGVTHEDGKILHNFIIPIDIELKRRIHLYFNFIEQCKEFTETLRQSKDKLQKFEEILNKML